MPFNGVRLLNYILKVPFSGYGEDNTSSSFWLFSQSAHRTSYLPHSSRAARDQVMLLAVELTATEIVPDQV